MASNRRHRPAEPVPTSVGNARGKDRSYSPPNWLIAISFGTSLIPPGSAQREPADEFVERAPRNRSPPVAWSRAPEELGRESVVRWENTKLGRLGLLLPLSRCAF